MDACAAGERESDEGGMLLVGDALAAGVGEGEGSMSMYVCTVEGLVNRGLALTNTTGGGG